MGIGKHIHNRSRAVVCDLGWMGYDTILFGFWKGKEGKEYGSLLSLMAG
jgi:hypothetical protein